MPEPRSNDLANLLHDTPFGQYLLEVREGLRLLWRISDGEPDDAAIEPAALLPELELLAA
jgi:hypothetical protein